MNWWAIFGAGLLAGATTCAVAQGGLLVGLITMKMALTCGYTCAARYIRGTGPWIEGQGAGARIPRYPVTRASRARVAGSP